MGTKKICVHAYESYNIVTVEGRIDGWGGEIFFGDFFVTSKKL